MQGKIFGRRASIRHGVPFALALAGQLAVAQTVLEEVIVTATRVERSLQDVPVSVTALSATQIEDYQLQNLADVMAYTPGAQGYPSGISGGTPSGAGLTIRGVQSEPTGSSASPGLVTMFDEMILTKSWMNPGASIHDLSRVEVLRGPQGTTFGRNSTAGVVHLVSNRPSLTEEFTETSLDFGTYDRTVLQLNRNNRLGENSALRVSAYYRSEDGHLKDETDGFTVGDNESKSIRIQLLSRPNERLETVFRLQWSDEEFEYPGLSDAIWADGRGGLVTSTYHLGPPFIPDIGSWTGKDTDTRTVNTFGPLEENLYERDLWSATAEVRYSFDSVNLTWISSYLDGRLDSQYTPWGAVAPTEGIHFTQFDTAELFQTELRFDNSSQETPLQWVAGLLYLTEDTSFFEEKEIFRHSNRWRTNHDFLNEGTNTSYGVFANMTYDLAPNTTVAAGVRHSVDEKDFRLPFQTCGSQPNLSGDPNAIVFSPTNICFAFLEGYSTGNTWFSGSGEDDWSDTSWRVSLSQRLGSEGNLHLYGSVSTAYTSGTFTSEPVDLPMGIPIEATNPEFVEALEVGLKGTVMDNRLRFDVVAHQSDWEDRQEVLLDPDTARHFTVNLPNVDIKGVEAQFDWRITDNFALLFTSAYVDAMDVDTGEQLLGVMKNSGTLGGVYDFQLANGSSLHANLNVVVNDDRTTNGGVAPASEIWSGSIVWTSANRPLSVRFWMRNITDDANILNVFRLPIRLSPQTRNVNHGPPRTAGISIDYRWD